MLAKLHYRQKLPPQKNVKSIEATKLNSNSIKPLVKFHSSGKSIRFWVPDGIQLYWPRYSEQKRL